MVVEQVFVSIVRVELIYVLFDFFFLARPRSGMA